MAANYSYTDPIYKQNQSNITKANWEKGIYNFFYNRIKRICLRSGCTNSFEVQLHDKKKYCSKSCAALVNNPKRIHSELTKIKIGNANRGKQNLFKGTIKVPRIIASCANPSCGNKFEYPRWKNRRFCSPNCAIKNIGSQTTSPKAAKGRSGIRPDIDPLVCFYSTWEANFARILNYVGINWEFGKRSFDLKTQTYTPDFYLPNHNVYIEIKNFLGEYSDRRDRLFRKFYPQLRLILIVKEGYLELSKQYSRLIPNWEY